eukprot:UN07865
MFNLTRMEILPSVNGKNDAIHSNSDILNMCLLSIHVHQANNICAYWYINGSMIRFFVNDMLNIWPLYFIQKRIDKENGISILQDIAPIARILAQKVHSIPLKDDNFDTFFEQNTLIKPINAYSKVNTTNK